MEKKQIENLRGKVTYWIHRHSSNRTIVLLHGEMGDHTVFNHQIAYFCKEYTVITVDLPLHGESKPYEDFTFTHVAEDLKQILDKEEIVNVILACHSAGGFVAQEFIRKYPDMVDAYVSISAVPFLEANKSINDIMIQKHYKLHAAVKPYDTYCKDISKLVAVTKEAREIFYDGLIRLGKEDMLTAADTIYGDIKNYHMKELQKIKCPVLLVAGELDQVGSVKKINEKLAEKMELPIVIIKQSGHNVSADNYTEFNKSVGDFLAKIPQAQ